MGAWSLIELQSLDLKIEHQDISLSNDRQGDMPCKLFTCNFQTI